LLPKQGPSFSRIWHGHLIDGFPLERGLETARQAMERRNVELTEAQEALLRKTHAETQFERERAIERFRLKSKESPG
jgi:hypothetical protein